MSTRPILSTRLVGRHTAARVAIMMALCGLAPIVAEANDVAPSTVSSADVPLSDLNLSSPEGISEARNRLRATAERLCADRSTGSKLSLQPAFEVCVDRTVANALRGIGALSKSEISVRNSVTLRTNVSLAGLDLSTLEGERIAQRRLQAMARRLCGDLSKRQDLLFPPDYAACLRDTLDGAWAQVNVIRTASDRRTAQRIAR